MSVPASTSSVGMINMMEHFAKRKDTKESQETAISDDVESEKSKFSEEKTENFTSGPVLPPNMTTFEPSGVKPRKPCNCTKSQCLKL